MQETATRKVLSVPQVAALLGKHEKTIRRWIKKGALPAKKAGPWGKYMIEEADLESLNYHPNVKQDAAEENNG